MREGGDSALLCLCKIHPAGTIREGVLWDQCVGLVKNFTIRSFCDLMSQRSEYAVLISDPFKGVHRCPILGIEQLFFFFLTLDLSLPGGRSGLYRRMVPEGLALSCVQLLVHVLATGC